jgi:soluble epoxide hydrolase/lipid-phosphate phosphatase
MTEAKQGPSSYKVQEEMLQRYPYNYFVTPLSSPPSAPQLTPTQRRYFYFDVSPPESTPTRATVLFLHGFPDTSYGWRHVLSSISLAGYRCIVPDLIGYGRSSKPNELAYYGAHSQALDLAGLMSHVMGSDSAKFAVVGHDWGSWLAWRLATWIPDRLMGVHGALQ